MEYRLLKHQAKFFNKFVEDYDTWALAIVSGFGGGKSYTLASTAVLLLLKYPGINVGVYSVTVDLLKLVNYVQIAQVLNKFGLSYTLNKTDKVFTVKGYGQIIMRSLDNPALIIGYETAFSLVDELDTLPTVKAEQAWNMIIARNRQLIPDTTQRNKVGVFTTPEGYRFVYKKWVKENNKGYELIRARTMDNIHLPPEYVQNLKDTYPDNLIEAYLNGHFVNLNGQAVYSKFDRVINNSNEIVLPEDTLHIGMDFNVEHMAAIVHVQRRAEDGTVHLHAVNEFVDLLDTPDMIETLKFHFHDYIVNNKVIVYPDSTGKSRKSSDSSKSDHALLKLARMKIKAGSVNPPVKDRIASVNNGFDKKHYHINVDNCPQLAEDLEQQVYRPDGTPDKSSGNDHNPDAAGYCRHYLFPIKSRRSHLQSVAI